MAGFICGGICPDWLSICAIICRSLSASVEAASRASVCLTIGRICSGTARSAGSSGVTAAPAAAALRV